MSLNMPSQSCKCIYNIQFHCNATSRQIGPRQCRGSRLRLQRVHISINHRKCFKLRHRGIYNHCDYHLLGGQQMLTSASESYGRGCLKLRGQTSLCRCKPKGSPKFHGAEPQRRHLRGVPIVLPYVGPERQPWYQVANLCHSARRPQASCTA